VNDKAISAGHLGLSAGRLQSDVIAGGAFDLDEIGMPKILDPFARSLAIRPGPQCRAEPHGHCNEYYTTEDEFLFALADA